MLARGHRIRVRNLWHVVGKTTEGSIWGVSWDERMTGRSKSIDRSKLFTIISRWGPAILTCHHDRGGTYAFRVEDSRYFAVPCHGVLYHVRWLWLHDFSIWLHSTVLSPDILDELERGTGESEGRGVREHCTAENAFLHLFVSCRISVWEQNDGLLQR